MLHTCDINKIVRVSSLIHIFFVYSTILFWQRRSSSYRAEKFSLIDDGANMSTQKRLSYLETLLNVVYIRACSNFICFSRSKFRTSSSRIKPCNLCLVYVHERISENCVYLMLSGTELLLTDMSASHFCNGMKQFSEQKSKMKLYFSQLKDLET